MLFCAGLGADLSLPKVVPALANLTQDIAGPVPVRLLQDWARGEQDLDAAQTLLNSFRIFGTVVSTDSSGLSKLTRAEDLLEVVHCISEPKEVVHAIGREIGGRAVGTWVADNTEMFFPSAVDVDTVLEAMAEVQARIRERLRVRLGMCVHTGCFYEISGGLYGPDADIVEDLAENFAGADEVLVTDAVVSQAKRIQTDELTPRIFERATGPTTAWVHRSPRRMPELREKETHYPHPFPEDFYRMLPLFGQPEQKAAIRAQLYSDWLREAVVVFLARHRDSGERSLSGLLDDLVANACMDAVIRNGAPGHGQVATCGGGLAILTFDDAQYALDYVRLLFAELSRYGLPMIAGIDHGPVLDFHTHTGRSGITGDPVNVASKLAEDAGAPGEINITNRAWEAIVCRDDVTAFERTVSGVTLNGYTLR